MDGTSGSAAAPWPARLLVYDRGSSSGGLLVERLRRGAPHAAVSLDDGRLSPLVVRDRAIDVLTIRLGGAACDGLVYAAEVAVTAPWVQLVFWLDEEAPSASQDAARSLGLGRLLGTDRLVEWLPPALGALAGIARAKRALHEAEGRLPPIPEASPLKSPPPIALPEAERQFRETYLRFLLSATPNARRAAERAGVPYTTLCSMIKKLGLSRA